MALYLESVPLRCTLGAAIAATLVASTQLPARAPEPLTVCQYHVAHPTPPAAPRHAYVHVASSEPPHERLAAITAMTIAERTDWQLHLGGDGTSPGHHFVVSAGALDLADRISCDAKVVVTVPGSDEAILLGTAQVELTPAATEVARELARDACLTSATESATLAAIERLERGVHDVAAHPPLRY